MWFARIDKEVWLCACRDTCFKERESVLRYHRSVISADDNLQFATEILCLRQKRCLCVSLWIGLWSVHIALAVHNLVPFPVDDRTAGHAYLEHVRVIGHK